MSSELRINFVCFVSYLFVAGLAIGLLRCPADSVQGPDYWAFWGILAGASVNGLVYQGAWIATYLWGGPSR